MFPFVQFRKRPWFGPSLLMASLVLMNLTTQTLDRAPLSVPAPQGDIHYLSDMETHLKSKAGAVVERFSSEDYTVDLNLALDTAQTTTTTYHPGEKILVQNQEKQETLNRDDGKHYLQNVRSQKWELTGTWIESTDVRPRIQTIRCCVTLAKGENIDHDHLYRCLSYELGIDLARGDLLQIIEQ